MRRLLAGLIVASCALDIATFYRLPLVGATELNPLTVGLGPLAVVAKLAFAAGLILAVKRQVPYFLPVGVLAAGWWGFGALVNSL